MGIDVPVLDWMVDSDPALRWQVERDLAGEPPEVWERTRARVATEGFGARLLAEQGADGQWDGGAFFPAGFDGSEEGQPWTATTWSLTSLREWGLDPAVLAGTAELLAANSRWEYDDLPYWDGEVDTCINARTLANGAWLGVDMSALARWMVEHQMAEGGWNCFWLEENATRASFHSTLGALRGILAYEQIAGLGGDALLAARRAGEEYLLTRKLLYKATTGELVGDWATQFRSPYRWRYSVLVALDYFRAASLYYGDAPDPRLGEAVEAVRAARQPDGTWLQGAPQPGRVWFDVDVPEGEPSKWLTLSGTRVLDWWDASHAS